MIIQLKKQKLQKLLKKRDTNETTDTTKTVNKKNLNKKLLYIMNNMIKINLIIVYIEYV